MISSISPDNSHGTGGSSMILFVVMGFTGPETAQYTNHNLLSEVPFIVRFQVRKVMALRYIDDNCLSSKSFFMSVNAEPFSHK